MAKYGISFVHSTSGSIGGPELLIQSQETSIEVIKSAASIDADLITARIDLPAIEAESYIEADIFAKRNIGKIRAESHIKGDYIVAGQNIHEIQGTGELHNLVAAIEGSVGKVRSADIYSDFIVAKDSVYDVTTHVGLQAGLINTFVIAGQTGFVGDVTAKESIAGVVYAPVSIGTIAGSRYTGAITTYGSIDQVTASDANINGPISAGTSIGPVSARTSIYGSLHSTKTMNGCGLKPRSMTTNFLRKF